MPSPFHPRAKPFIPPLLITLKDEGGCTVAERYLKTHPLIYLISLYLREPLRPFAAPRLCLISLYLKTATLHLAD